MCDPVSSSDRFAISTVQLRFLNQTCGVIVYLMCILHAMG